MTHPAWWQYKALCFCVLTTSSLSGSPGFPKGKGGKRRFLCRVVLQGPSIGLKKLPAGAGLGLGLGTWEVSETFCLVLALPWSFLPARQAFCLLHGLFLVAITPHTANAPAAQRVPGFSTAWQYPTAMPPPGATAGSQKSDLRGPICNSWHLGRDRGVGQNDRPGSDKTL